jgi:predicted CoA-binding protein
MAEANCEFPEKNAKSPEIDAILKDSKVIAVIGLSADPGKPSNHVAAYLKVHGYTIIPVNPGETAILGEKSYPSLKDVPGPVDVVDIFRKPEAVPGIVEEVIDRACRQAI